ncbi:hypothetical protein JXQ70_03210 [bacterium]|nr:hypothetical protein [bacterium]
MSFQEQLEQVYRLRGSKKIDQIISSPHALKLARMLPEEEVYLTLKEVGEEDALLLYELTDFKQAQYIYDLEWWDKEELEPDKVVFWLGLMLETNSRKLMEWVRESEPETLVAVFQKLIRIYVFDNVDELRGDADELYYFSVDNLFFIEFINDEHEDILKKVITELRSRDRQEYYRLMQGISWSIASETEENAADLRRSRLDLKGFRELHEAMSIYQPLPGNMPERMRLSDVRPEIIPEHEYSPRYALERQKKKLYFSQVLALVSDKQLLDRIRFELIQLSHRILVTDGLKPDYKTLQQSLRKAFDMVNIGLESLCSGDPEQALAVIEHNYLEHIFRVGYEPIRQIHDRTARIVHALEHDTREFWLAFLDHPWGDVVKAMLKARPQFYVSDSEQSSPVRERDFETSKDIELTNELIGQAELILTFFKDRLGFHLDLSLPIESPLIGALVRDIDWIKLFNTMLVQYVTQNVIKLGPLDIIQIPVFYGLFFDRSAPDIRLDAVSEITQVELFERFVVQLQQHGALHKDELTLFQHLSEKALAKLSDMFEGIILERTSTPDYRLFPGLWIKEELHTIM